MSLLRQLASTFCKKGGLVTSPPTTSREAERALVRIRRRIADGVRHAEPLGVTMRSSTLAIVGDSKRTTHRTMKNLKAQLAFGVMLDLLAVLEDTLLRDADRHAVDVFDAHFGL